MANIKYKEYGTIITKKQGVVLAEGSITAFMAS